MDGVARRRIFSISLSLFLRGCIATALILYLPTYLPAYPLHTHASILHQCQQLSFSHKLLTWYTSEAVDAPPKTCCVFRTRLRMRLADGVCPGGAHGETRLARVARPSDGLAAALVVCVCGRRT